MRLTAKSTQEIRTDDHFLFSYNRHYGRADCVSSFVTARHRWDGSRDLGRLHEPRWLPVVLLVGDRLARVREALHTSAYGRDDCLGHNMRPDRTEKSA